MMKPILKHRTKVEDEMCNFFLVCVCVLYAYEMQLD